MSPFLYILAADTLSRIFTKGRQAHVIKGLGPPCLDNLAITNCHYADDTILFLDAQEENVEAAWWAMLAFEAISGIRMNYDKTELYLLHVADTQPLQYLFRCHEGTFPIKYLGLPLHYKKLQVVDWSFLVNKVESKLQQWQGSLLSIGGRLTLTNSVLTAVPLYALSVYRIPLTVIKQIDKIRRRFLWQGNSKNKKIYSHRLVHLKFS